MSNNNTTPPDRQQHHRVVSLFMSALHGKKTTDSNSGGGVDGDGDEGNRTEEGFSSGSSGISSGNKLLYAPAGQQVFNEMDPVQGSLSYIPYDLSTPPPPVIMPSMDDVAVLRTEPPSSSRVAAPNQSRVGQQQQLTTAESVTVVQALQHMQEKIDRLSNTVQFMERSVIQAMFELMWYVAIGILVIFVADQFLWGVGVTPPPPGRQDMLRTAALVHSYQYQR